MKCPNCNNEVSEEWAICPFCKYEPKRCPKCNMSWLPQDAKFCPVCGNKLDANPSCSYTQEVLTFVINNVSFNMIFIKGGKYMMGTNVGHENEQPIHEVELSDFYIAETLITQQLWEIVMGRSIDAQMEKANVILCAKGVNFPMCYISWHDCKVFIDKLNNLLREQLHDRHFDFPTEAQWEYAARGGLHNGMYKYSGSDNLNDVAWHLENSQGQIHEVKKKKANELGIFDMSGNVFEWCKDDWDFAFYSSDKAICKDPECKAPSMYHVARGGGWQSDAAGCRVTFRNSYFSPFCYADCGLRIVLQ